MTELINPKTRSHRIRLHRRMWRWLAENPEAEKSDWPGWKKYTPQYAGCFMCSQQNCTVCPLVWPKNIHGYDWCLEGGLYTQWDKTELNSERSALAEQIAELPVRRIKKKD